MFAEGARDHSQSTGVPHQPFEIISDRRTQTTDQTIGTLRGLAGARVAGTVIAGAVGFRQSTIDVADTILADGGARATSSTTNDIIRLQLGALRPLDRTRSLGLTWAHDLVSSTAVAGTQHMKTTGHADAGILPR
ncbi:MAG: hypothetical protein O2782_05940 [bacterium]|nr:hypothetical protein [bacterium]